ncbi:endonuclease VII domain-containing protein [Methyloceanibacter caenitepidi]|uniref:endonuclease VII domain-containing protein n=1 Tax=Methyloceanibacter caenitepidi TaxID=1384459 RepID=UPI0009E4BEF2
MGPAQREKVRRYDRQRKLRKKYNKSEEELRAILKQQGDVCRLCGTDSPNSKYGWHTDHCSETGRVRGILCRRCNTAIGHFNHDPKLLRVAAIYLEAFDLNVEDGEF